MHLQKGFKDKVLYKNLMCLVKIILLCVCFFIKKVTWGLWKRVRRDKCGCAPPNTLFLLLFSSWTGSWLWWFAVTQWMIRQMLEAEPVRIDPFFKDPFFYQNTSLIIYLPSYPLFPFFYICKLTWWWGSHYLGAFPNMSSSAGSSISLDGKTIWASYHLLWNCYPYVCTMCHNECVILVPLCTKINE